MLSHNALSSSDGWHGSTARMNHSYHHPHLLLLARKWPTLTYVLVSFRPTGRSPKGAPGPSTREQTHNECMVRHGQPPSVQHGRAPTHQDRDAQVLARPPTHGGQPRDCCRPGWHRRERKFPISFCCCSVTFCPWIFFLGLYMFSSILSLPSAGGTWTA